MADTWRYWRINMSAPGVSDFLEAFEIEFLKDSVDQTAPGGTVTTNFDVFNQKANLVDNNTSSFWAAWGANHATNLFCNITYDFSSNANLWKAINSMSYMCRTGRGPKWGHTIDCSHDNVNWINVFTQASGLTWGSSEKKTWTFTAPQYAENKRVGTIIQR